MMARIDMEYQAELKHELKCMQKISHKTKRKHPDINDLRGEKKRQQIKATVNQFACFRLRLSQFWIQESSSKSWKDSNKHTFHPLQKGKRHLGPVKMIKSITPYKQCEVWGGYNSIRWNWEDTLIKRKKLYALCVCTV